MSYYGLIKYQVLKTLLEGKTCISVWIISPFQGGKIMDAIETEI